ncbi:MAG: 23S rRNA methyltransferase, partial [Rhizobium sp.]
MTGCGGAVARAAATAQTIEGVASMTKAPIGVSRTGRKLGQRVTKKKMKASSRQWLHR